VNLATMRGLVEQGRSLGVLVYDHGRPVGWCQFVPKDELRFTSAAASGAAWFVTCFVIHPRYRGIGATGVALRAAVKAMSRKGGGIVEGHATAIAPGPPPKPAQKGTHLEGDVLFHRGRAKVRFGLEVAGVGPVSSNPTGSSCDVRSESSARNGERVIRSKDQRVAKSNRLPVGSRSAKCTSGFA
jgi:hypothetical protein